GMWYSGQTTVLVLKTMLSIIPRGGSGAGGQAKLGVRINDRDARTLDLPPARTVAAPLEVDVTDLAKVGENRVELDILGDSGDMDTLEGAVLSAQFSAEAYIPWKASETDTTAKTNANSKLKFVVSYSTTQAPAGSPIECRVKVERLGYRG